MDSQYISTTVNVKCRVGSCKLVLLRKNYKDHLLKKHPEEDPHDLTPFGQNRISAFVIKKSHYSSNEPKDSDLVDENSNLDLTVDALELPTTLGKRKKPNSDSVDHEIDNKRSKLGKENEKLEEILSEIKSLNKKIDDKFDSYDQYLFFKP